MPFDKIRPARIVQRIQRVNCQGNPRIYAIVGREPMWLMLVKRGLGASASGLKHHQRAG